MRRDQRARTVLLQQVEGLYERMCMACHRAYRKEHYKKNRVVYIAKAMRNSAVTRRFLDKWVNDLKAAPCSRCKQSYPSVCMDFHHRDPESKVLGIPQMRSGAWSLDRVLKEVKKCDLLCANCHRIVTHAAVCPLATNELKG